MTDRPRISAQVERNPWMIVRPPAAKAVQTSLISQSSISWKEVERTVAIVEAWCATPFGKQVRPRSGMRTP